MNDTDGYMLKK